ncbi:MAG TPA: hypothetical protein VFE22_15075 [Edaphobacter sp.]|nr:hypothetical protein [Edaphobacter sp.]
MTAHASGRMGNEGMAWIGTGCSTEKAVADAEGWWWTVQQAGTGWFAGECVGQSVEEAFAWRLIAMQDEDPRSIVTRQRIAARL